MRIYKLIAFSCLLTFLLTGTLCLSIAFADSEKDARIANIDRELSQIREKNARLQAETGRGIDWYGFKGIAAVSGTVFTGTAAYGIFVEDGYASTISEIVALASGITFGVSVMALASAPNQAASATLSDYYATREGFPEFLKLSPEMMLYFAASDAKLAALVAEMARIDIERIQPHKQVNSEQQGKINVIDTKAI